MTGQLLAAIVVPAVLAVSLATRPGIAVQTPAVTKVSVAEVSAPPGAPVVLPVTLGAPEGVSIGTVEFRLTYSTTLLTFVKMEPSGLALGLGAVLQAVVEKGPDARSATLRGSVSAPMSGASRQPLPSGPLAYVAFTIAKSAKPGTSIVLTHVASASTSDAAPQPITPVVAAKVKIDVARPPVPACFFYMH